MWFIGKSILAYLIRENIKDKEKEKLITKRQALIKLEISNLKDEDLINYLLHPNMPIEVKELICERINKIENTSYKRNLSGPAFRLFVPGNINFNVFLIYE